MQQFHEKLVHDLIYRGEYIVPDRLENTGSHLIKHIYNRDKNKTLDPDLKEEIIKIYIQSPRNALFFRISLHNTTGPWHDQRLNTPIRINVNSPFLNYIPVTVGNIIELEPFFLDDSDLDIYLQWSQRNTLQNFIDSIDVPTRAGNYIKHFVRTNISTIAKKIQEASFTEEDALVQANRWKLTTKIPHKDVFYHIVIKLAPREPSRLIISGNGRTFDPRNIFHICLDKISLNLKKFKKVK
jgi:phosphoribosyl-ATP pyrophosphohydrolase